MKLFINQKRAVEIVLLLQIDKKVSKIDKLVYKLYNLTYEEMKIVEGNRSKE